MVRAFPVLLCVLSLMLTVSLAQEKKIELIPYLGYSASSGVNIQEAEIDDGVIASKIIPKSGFIYGFTLNYFYTERLSFGFNFAEQNSQLDAGIFSGGKRTLTDMKLDNYHGVMTFNFGEEEEQIRPYVFGGIGATQYRFSPIDGSTVDSNTRFSTTWGGGIKVFLSERIGISGQLRWTPTHIRSDPDGVWCSPGYPWSCWVLPNDHYSHQAAFTTGVTFRF